MSVLRSGDEIHRVIIGDHAGVVTDFGHGETDAYINLCRPAHEASSAAITRAVDSHR